jgi:DNA-binding beta-propeller fold protein YncE
MNDLNRSRKPAARTRSGGLSALFLMAGLLAMVTPLRADNPPTYLFEIDASAVPGGSFIPEYLALDSSNNVYVTDVNNICIFKFTAFGEYLTKWGTPGSGNGQLQGPRDIAVDSSNNVYVADDINFRVEKFDSNGNYLTQWGYVNGNGENDYFYWPGVAVDNHNNVYVTAPQNCIVEKFASNGNYLTQWGSAGSDNGQLYIPAGVAVDSSNNVYVADEDNNRVEKFNSYGGYLTQWGSQGSGNGQFEYPPGIAVDSSNNVYVTDIENARVEKFDSNGNYLTQWGGFLYPIGVAVDRTGNYIYVADQEGSSIEVFANNTNIIPPFLTQPPTNQTVPAGANVIFTVGVVGGAALAYQWSSDNVAVPGATNATFTLTNISLAASGTIYSVLVSNSYGSALSTNAMLTVLPAAEFVVPTYLFQINSSSVPGGFYPYFVALDGSNNVYVGDGSSNRIVKFTALGAYLTQWGSYGSGSGQFYSSGTGDIAVDSSNNVYVADSGNYRIEKFDSNGNYLTQWGSEGSGNGQFLEYLDFGGSPTGIAVDRDNNIIYATDTGNYRIEKFNGYGGYLTQWGSYGVADSAFTLPGAIAVDNTHNVYVAQSGYGANLIEKFDSNGNHLAQWGSQGSGDGQFDGQFDNIGGIAVDPSNYVYVVDEGNNRIEKFYSDGTYLTQWGGSGGGIGQLNYPNSVAVDSTGNFIYVSDAGGIEVFANNTSNLPPFITIQPMSQTVPGGINLSFSVSVAGGAPFTYQWISNNVAVPGATNATFALANVNLADSGSTYSVLVTNSYGSALGGNAVLTVLPSIVLTQPASSITTNSAVLNGSVTVGPDETVAWFEWGTDTNYGNIADETIVLGNNASNNLSTALNGLTDNVYHYRIDAANDFGIVYGNDEVFAIGLAPTATTLAAVNSTNGSTLNATVNPNGLDTTVYFRWGTLSYSLNNLTPIMDVGAGTTPLNVSSFITGLAPFTQYHFQVVASNYLGARFGATIAFYSPPFVGVPNQNWDSVASSADGSVLVAVANGNSSTPPFSAGGPIFISTNSGVTWAEATGAPTNGLWETVACSADGSKIIAAGGGGFSFVFPIYTSSDTGATWVSNNAPVVNWQSVASSADGTRLVAAATLNQVIYTSTNSGAVWTQATNAPKVSWFSVALSADGSKLAAVAIGSTKIYTSTNFGATWIINNVPVGPLGIQNDWSSIASSADGSRLVAVGGGNGGSGFIFISTNSGAAWKLTATNIVSSLVAHPWIGVASSADGSKLAAVADVANPLGVVITSTNSGASWTTNAVPYLDWNAVALSADGAKLVATVGYPSTGPIYVSQTTPVPVLNLSAPDNVISWIIPSLDFTLQQSPDLSNWTDVTNLPVLNLTNLQNQVVLPPPDGNSFFRLMH